jgi:diguanylate cyclase (GGDEF)-like protein
MAVTEGPSYHRALERQLRRLGLSAGAPPDAARWAELLGQVSAAYRDAEADRYTLERSLEVSSDEMRALHDVLSDQARHDALTGLPNRAALGDVLRDALERRRSASDDVAVLFLDLDGFKLVNDSLGHSAGDELLVRAAERIRAAVRDTDVVARLGGDEFVVVCRQVEEVDAVVAIATRIADQLERPFRLRGQDSVVSASVGIALAAPGETNVDDVLRRADMAMYEAKAGGRCQFVVFDDEISRRVEGRLATLNDLRQAVDGNEFVLRYQPIVRLSDGDRIGIEALIRWERPGHGLLTPDAFIPIAEESRLITAIDGWVIQTACAQVIAHGLRHLELAVNLSARDLHHPDLVDSVSTALQRTGLPARRLVMELTETTLVSSNTAIAANLARLQSLGVQLAIDDFGTGYSSLSYLRQLPAKTLKIDSSFISTLDQDASSAAIVGAIVQMGHALGLTIVAEGVERETQAERLFALGCDAAQGFLFAHPQPIEDLAPLRAVS